MMNKPSWKVESDYDCVDKLSLPQLAFEFLRRNPDYIKDYQRFAEVEAELTVELGPKASNYQEWKDAGRKIGTIWDPPRMPGESLQSHFHRTIDHPCDPKAFWYEDWFQNKWGLEGGFPSPATPTTCELKFKTQGAFPFLPTYQEAGLFFHGDSIDHEPFSQVTDVAVLAFNLNSPMDIQLAEAKQILQAEIKRRSDEHEKVFGAVKSKQTVHFRDKFKTYLRVWDAEVSGEEKKNVAEIIFGEEAKLKSKKDCTDPNNFMLVKRNHSHKSAAQFVSHKYRLIPNYKD